MDVAKSLRKKTEFQSLLPRKYSQRDWNLDKKKDIVRFFDKMLPDLKRNFGVNNRLPCQQKC